MADKMNREELLANEDALLEGLLRAGAQIESAEGAVLVEIARNGELLFAFEVRPLTEMEFLECRQKCTIYKRNQGGIRVPVEFNQGFFRSMIIHTATVPSRTGKKVWDAKQAWERFGVASGIELIDKVLLAGEKDRVYDKIEEISGYRAEAPEETEAELEAQAGE